MRGKTIRLTALIGVVAGVMLAAPGSAGAVTFTNGTPLSPPLAGGQTSSAISVAGQSGTVAKAQVTLRGTGFDTPSDLDILVVGPSGARAMLMSDACPMGSFANSGNITLDDGAGGLIPDTCGMPSGGGTFKPTDRPPNGGDNPMVDGFLAPAPTAGPYPASLAGFIGSDPNGTWTLYAFDDTNPGANNMDSGWSLNLDVAPPAPIATTTPVAALPVTAPKKCKKGRKLKRGKCVKKKKKK